MNPGRTTTRRRVLHWPIVTATHQQRSTPARRSLARLVKKDGSIVGGDDAAPSPIWNMLGHHDLTLIWLDRRKFWQ